jgi:release factor glutamine methyltransferase
MSHLRGEDFEAVYEPSDDTFLLLDALASDVACLRGQLPGICVELGSGSGAVITGLSQILSRAGIPGSASALMATDLNLAANAASARTAAANGASMQVQEPDTGFPGA